MKAGGTRWVEYPSRSDEIRLYWTADWHISNSACAMKQLKRDLKLIEDDPCGLWLGGGDYSDCIGVADRRFDPEVFSPDVSVHELGRLGHALGERVRDLMGPIAPKCLGLLYGNHEDKYMQSHEAQQLHGWLCQELGVMDLTYSTIFDIGFRRNPRSAHVRLVQKARSGDSWTVRVMAHHGAGAAQTPGGKLNKLRRAMDFFPHADLVLLAHVHEQKVEPSTVLDGNHDCTEIVEHRRTGAIAGTYLRTYAEGVATYGEKKLYRPVPIGHTMVTFRPQRKQMLVTV